MAITPLPPIPTRSDPDFSNKADTAWSAMPQMVAEMNATAAAMNLNSTNSISATPMLIAVAQKSFTVEAAKSYVPGQTLKIAYTTDPSQWMLGDVMSYNVSTGVITVDVQYRQGAGTYADWTVSLAAPAPVTIPAGTKMFFSEATAPVGWVQITSNTNMALRLVNDASGGSTGGSVNFTDAFKSQAVTGSNSATTLAESQMPWHQHYGGVNIQQYLGDIAANLRWVATASTASTGDKGGSQPHNHTFTGTPINLAVKFMNVILARKE